MSQESKNKIQQQLSDETEKSIQKLTNIKDGGLYIDQIQEGDDCTDFILDNFNDKSKDNFEEPRYEYKEVTPTSPYVKKVDKIFEKLHNKNKVPLQ